MRNFAIAIAGFLVGAAAIAGVAVAFSNHTTNVTVSSAAPQTSMPMSHMTSGMMTSAVTTAAPATRKLTIVHVQRGCHVWSNGTKTGATMRLKLRQGGKLSILDMDVDAHQMLQFAGPTHLRLGGPMMMNHGVTIAFAKKGVYRLGTKTVEMPGGMEMDVKTIGPDNNLRLVVTVA